MKAAIIVVDIVNDFVSGKFATPESMAVVPRIRKFLDGLGERAPVIFTLDTHIKNDPEFAVWGEHCLIDTWGCKQVDELKDSKGYRIYKRHFDSFHDTDLDGYLRANGIEHLFIFGISTDICVLHTAGGAFFRHYSTTVISDLCASISPERHLEGLSFMKRNYGIDSMTAEKALEVI